MTIRQKDTTITIEVDKIYTSRLIGNKLCSLTIEVDGTIKDLIAKINRVVGLDTELYKQFAELSKYDSV